jgi:hypothetical protein
MTMKLVYPILLAFAVAALLYVEWHTDEVTLVLALLLILAAALGFLRPVMALATGIVIGLAIPLAHLMSMASGRYQPAYQAAPPAGGDWAAMALLVLPALAAAYAGAWLGLRAGAGADRSGTG